MISLDTLIAAGIVVGAAVYLYRKFAGAKKSGGCGCSAGGGCGGHGHRAETSCCGSKR